MKVNVE